MTEEIPSGEETATVEVSELPGKCTTQSVLTAVLKLRYLSSLTLTDQSTAETVFLTTGNPEKTDINIRFTQKNSILQIMSVSFSLSGSNGLSFFIMIY